MSFEEIVENKNETLGKPQICSRVSEQTGVPYKEVAKVYDGLSKVIVDAVAENNNVRIIGLGTFTSRYSKPHLSRNPQTGKPVKIPGRIVPKIRWSGVFRRTLIDALKKMKEN